MSSILLVCHVAPSKLKCFLILDQVCSCTLVFLGSAAGLHVLIFNSESLHLTILHWVSFGLHGFHHTGV